MELLIFCIRVFVIIAVYEGIKSIFRYLKTRIGVQDQIDAIDSEISGLFQRDATNRADIRKLEESSINALKWIAQLEGQIGDLEVKK